MKWTVIFAFMLIGCGKEAAPVATDSPPAVTYSPIDVVITWSGGGFVLVDEYGTKQEETFITASGQETRRVMRRDDLGKIYLKIRPTNTNERRIEIVKGTERRELNFANVTHWMLVMF